MELVNDFVVGVPPAEAWRILTDLERIAPCMPGAQLEEVEGDEYRGVLKIKLGPIQAQYKGIASFSSMDEAAGTAVITASGRDARQGTASAEITATLTETATGTQVRLVTQLTLSGKIAQFSRGVLPDVSAKLLAEFVQNLEAEVLVVPIPTEDGDRRIEAREVAPVDLLETAGAPVAKRLIPLVAAVVVLWLVVRRSRRKRRRSPGVASLSTDE